MCKVCGVYARAYSCATLAKAHSRSALDPNVSEHVAQGTPEIVGHVAHGTPKVVVHVVQVTPKVVVHVAQSTPEVAGHVLH